MLTLKLYVLTKIYVHRISVIFFFITYATVSLVTHLSINCTDNYKCDIHIIDYVQIENSSSSDLMNSTGIQNGRPQMLCTFELKFHCIQMKHIIRGFGDMAEGSTKSGVIPFSHSSLAQGSMIHCTPHPNCDPEHE